uniref:Exocyst complex component Sec8 n=1 Tax=Schistocephalus solidus TaxID=70667 RepID=A0A0X3PGE4_SCHSO
MTQSSYLMSFIHGLLEHSSKDVRERKREQLAREYKETEEVVNVCLNEKYEEVTKILNVYREVSQNLETIRSAVRKVKKDIGECKNFLACNREELRRLWLDLIEQRRSLELIDIIDRVRLAPDIINNLISARAWPEATDFLLSIHKLAETEVRSVPALDGTMAELAVKKKTLFEEICQSLLFLIFKQPLALVLHDRSLRCGTSLTTVVPDMEGAAPRTRSSVVVDSDPVSGEITKVKHFSDLPLSDWRSLPVDPPAVNSNLQKDPRAVTAALLASTGAAKEQRKLATQPLYVQPRSKLYSDQLLTDEKKWADAIVALTHCLNRLQKLPQVFSSWRVKAHIGSTAAGTGPLGTSGLGSGSDSHPRKKTSSLFAPGQSLLTEIHNSIVLPAVAEIERNVAAQGQPFPLSSLAEPSYLTELLQLIFPALYMHFNAVMLMIRTMRTIKQRTPEVSFEFLDLLNEEYVWEYIQDEVRSVLSAHLASSGTGYAGGPLSDARSKAAFDANQIDLNAAMGKRRSHNFFGSGSSSIASSGAGTNSEAGSAVGGISEAQQALSSDGEPSNTATSNTFFSFSKTSHSLSVNSYLRENRLNLPFDLPANHGLLNDGPGDVTDSSSGKLAVGERGNFPVGNYPLVCRPAYSNVRAIYSLVIDFTKTIEEQPISASRVLSHVLDNSTVSSLRNSRNSTSATSSTGSLAVGLKGALVALGAPKFVDKNLVIHCGLRTFLVDFIERVYLPEAQLDMRQHLVQILSAPDFLTNTVDQQSKRELGINKPILNSVVLTNQLLNEVQQMTIALPDYAGNCSRIGATLLETFIDWTSRAYRNLTIAKTSGSSIPSADWAKDCDLSRFWTKFPVWQRMAAAESYAAATSAQLANTGVDSINVNATTVLASKTGNMSSNTGTMAMDPVPAIVLGMPNLISSSSGIESSSGNLPDSHAANLLPFYGPDNQNPQNTGAGHDELILHERETTRLAVKEMDQLLHMIHDEVGSSSDISLCTANLPTIKKNWPAS